MFRKWYFYVQQKIFIFNEWFLYVQQMISIVTKWLLHVQQMIFRFSKWLLHSTRNLYIQQFEIYVRFLLNNLKFAFNEMKFIKLKSFTFSKPNLDVTQYTSKAFGRTKNLVCKLYIQSVSIFSHFSNVLCTLKRWCWRAKFSVSFYCPNGQWTYVENWDGSSGLVTSLWTSTRFLHEHNYDLCIFL